MEIVSFGKYKGKTVKELLQDTKYLQWCRSQPGIVQKYPYLNLNNPSIINNPTPRHNSLQNSFLEKEKCYEIIKSIFNNRYSTLDCSKYYNDFKLNPISLKHDLKIQFEKDNWDLGISLLFSNHTYLVKNMRNKISTEEGNDFKNIFKDYIEFEAVFTKYNYILNIKDICVYIELKTYLGDDYPCVLRKISSVMNDKGFYVLYIQHFNSETTTLEELKTIFKLSNILVILE